MDRDHLIGRALLLSVASVTLSGALGGLAIVAGLLSGRLSLLGFGLDSAIDAIASIVLVWRFQLERRDLASAERAERAAERAVGAVLCAAAASLAIAAGRALLGGERPDASIVPLGIAIVSLAALPFLALAKLKVAAALDSRALRADGVLTGVAAVLALASLSGFVLTETFGLVWADALAALLMSFVLAREGAAALRRQGLAGAA
jgi:divalent metal cation (Fe/Co/Zn/Cd) transporter